MNHRLTASYLITNAIEIIRDTHAVIERRLQRNPAERFKKVTIHNEGTDKEALVIDQFAEENCIDEFQKRFYGTVRVLGEESLSQGVDLSGVTQICALVDMVDG